MLEKPPISEDSLLTTVRSAYDLFAVTLEFLPLGNDSSAWVYRLRTGDANSFFLKVRRGAVDESATAVPRYLNDQGITAVVAPLRTRSGDLWAESADYTLLLYPFIEGRDGMSAGLNATQWQTFGSSLKRIHSLDLPPEWIQRIPHETFVPKWSHTTRRLAARIVGESFSDPLSSELAAFWRSRRAEIDRIVRRADEYGALLRERPPAFVLCHTDCHTANTLIDDEGCLFIVDWDQPLLAPVERDLMFVIGSAAAPGMTDEERWFLQGYGAVHLDALTLAYYRYEWIVQEIGDFGARVFELPHLGDVTRRDSVDGFRKLFEPGGVVDQAYAAADNL
jgi:spectinomycin phosphotransferase